MGLVGAEEHGFAGVETHVVEDEGAEEADVVGELAVEAQDEFGESFCGNSAAAGEAGWLVLGKVDELFRAGLNLGF